LDTIQNVSEFEFSEKDIEFMVEFKKIYELGLDQLQKFIDKLDEEGEELDTYSILYYVSVLLNGPLGNYVREFSEGKKYFTNTPDTMGMLGNKTKSIQNDTIYPTIEYPLGASVDTFNKLPLFIQETLGTAVEQTEEIFRGSLKSTSVNDNTLPVIDKNPQQRYVDEKDGLWVKKSNGSYMVKDRYFYLAVDDKSRDIFEKVQEYLGEENFRIYRDKKDYNAFDSEKNQSESKNEKIEKEFTEIVNDEEKTLTITLDLMGDEFDSEDRRKSELKIPSDDKDRKFKLNTNEGQLGNRG
jgi:hypothetical protein